jgi:Zinc-binding dehydrogenase
LLHIQRFQSVAAVRAKAGLQRDLPRGSRASSTLLAINRKGGAAGLNGGLADPELSPHSLTLASLIAQSTAISKPYTPRRACSSNLWLPTRAVRNSGSDLACAFGTKRLALPHPFASHHIEHHELEEAANEVFRMILSGKVKPAVHQRYSLSEVARAHCDLEEGRTTGSTVLTVDD